ncbi:MAG: hypothetical protein J3K34DRAFT_230638 [Monoraphidium minutum]|nr:MAG: hypothetical protein J3K34DRAFT_230638 [Monoraphidium minutum]
MRALHERSPASRRRRSGPCGNLPPPESSPNPHPCGPPINTPSHPLLLHFAPRLLSPSSLPDSGSWLHSNQSLQHLNHTLPLVQIPARRRVQARAAHFLPLPRACPGGTAVPARGQPPARPLSSRVGWCSCVCVCVCVCIPRHNASFSSVPCSACGSERAQHHQHQHHHSSSTPAANRRPGSSPRRRCCSPAAHMQRNLRSAAAGSGPAVE